MKAVPDVERYHAELRKIFRAAKEAAAQRTIRNEPEFQQFGMDLSGRSGVVGLQKEHYCC